MVVLGGCVHWCNDYIGSFGSARGGQIGRGVFRLPAAVAVTAILQRALNLRPPGSAKKNFVSDEICI